MWRRPHGVARGTWTYVNERSIAAQYDAFVEQTPLCRLDERMLRSRFPPRADGATQVVLDLGSGTGRSTFTLASLGYRVVAVDLSQAMLEVLRQKAATLPIQAGLPDSRPLTVKANLVELACIADRSCDHAICLFSTLGMIQGKDERHAFLCHVARIVRPGGRLFVHVHNRWSAVFEPGGLRSLLGSWWRSMTSRQCEFGDATYRYRGIDGMFLHRWSRREFVVALRAAGWCVQQVDEISVDGSRRLGRGLFRSYRAGGFFATARRPES